MVINRVKKKLKNIKKKKKKKKKIEKKKRFLANTGRWGNRQ